MRYVAIARHGDPLSRNYESGLSELGVEQAQALGVYLKNQIGEGSIRLITSPLGRAQETARIVAGELGASSVETLDYLAGSQGINEGYTEGNVSYQRRLMSNIESRGRNADAVVVISHEDVCEDFATFYLRAELAINGLLDRIGRGQAFLFDLVERTVRKIP
ncbi:MAG: histidine phosphatase family protein [Candidatus Aenigmarchaeota archaeon]|nr:histidine phosphatase family protein [Candidatus Aenigmarchaeota archaeon]